MIGDETFHLTLTDVNALEQPLRHLHRSLGREPELATRFLRQRRRGERRRRALDAGLLLNVGDRPRNIGPNGLDQLLSCRAVQQASVLILEGASLSVEVFSGGDPRIVDAERAWQ